MSDDTASDTEHEIPVETYLTSLKTIDQLATKLLTDISARENLEDEARQEAIRHLREVRAEVDPLMLTLQCLSDAEQSSDDLEMIADRGPGTITHLGPAPAAFEKSEHGDETDEYQR